VSDRPARSTCRQRHRLRAGGAAHRGQAAADVDGVLGMMAADDGAAERRGAMVMAANVVLVAVSDRSICGVAPP